MMYRALGMLPVNDQRNMVEIIGQRPEAVQRDRYRAIKNPHCAEQGGF